MGCHSSTKSMTDGKQESLADDERSTPFWTQSLLKDKQKEVIYNTWRHLSDNMVDTGMRVFQYIFTRRPEVKNLFTFIHLAMSELPTNPYFRAHATHFMQAISTAVDNLDDFDLKLTPLMLALGKQHSMTRGFGIHYFEVFTQCLIIVWEERLGDKFTPEVRAAWEKLFVFMLMTLREGYALARGHYDSQELTAQDPDVNCNE